jgi:hypothetical protein
MADNIRLVQVEWLDHCDADGDIWISHERAGECQPATFLSVGWLVHEDDDVLRISWSRATDGSLWSRPSVIVRACVISITVLIPEVRSL